jgi:hypothetical protein
MRIEDRLCRRAAPGVPVLRFPKTGRPDAFRGPHVLAAIAFDAEDETMKRDLASIRRSWRRSSAFGIVVVAFLGLIASGAGAATGAAQTGDTCTATGSGTAYTLNVTIPSGAPQQFGFAFGASAHVTNVNVAGLTGSLVSQNLPSNTTQAWITESPLLPGSAVASLATSAGVKGSFVVVPASSAQGAFDDAITCTLAPGKTVASGAFTVSSHASYVASAGGWRLVVSIGAAGTVSANELEPTSGTAGSKQTTAKSLVQARKSILKSPGKVTLTLKPTAQGEKSLSSTGAIKLKLDVAFAPTGGKSSTKIVTLTLKR